MRQTEIDSEDFEQWLDHPITQRVRQHLETEIERLEEQWTKSLLSGHQNYELLRTAILNRQEALAWALQLTEAELNEESSEHVGDHST